MGTDIPRPLSRGTEGIVNRLRDSSDKIEQMERHLTAERRRRDLLILKLTQSGLTTRQVGMFGRISSPAVTYAIRRAKEAHGVK